MWLRPPHSEIHNVLPLGSLVEFPLGLSLVELPLRLDCLSFLCESMKQAGNVSKTLHKLPVIAA